MYLFVLLYRVRAVYNSDSFPALYYHPDILNHYHSSDFQSFVAIQLLSNQTILTPISLKEQIPSRVTNFIPILHESSLQPPGFIVAALILSGTRFPKMAPRGATARKPAPHSGHPNYPVMTQFFEPCCAYTNKANNTSDARRRRRMADPQESDPKGGGTVVHNDGGETPADEPKSSDAQDSGYYK